MGPRRRGPSNDGKYPAIARNIFFGQYKDDITFGATHYHADYVYPAWRKSKTKTLVVGNHIFYRWENNERR